MRKVGFAQFMDCPAQSNDIVALRKNPWPGTAHELRNL